MSPESVESWFYESQSSTMFFEHVPTKFSPNNYIASPSSNQETPPVVEQNMKQKTKDVLNTRAHKKYF